MQHSTVFLTTIFLEESPTAHSNIHPNLNNTSIPPSLLTICICT